MLVQIHKLREKVLKIYTFAGAEIRQEIVLIHHHKGIWEGAQLSNLQHLFFGVPADHFL